MEISEHIRLWYLQWSKRDRLYTCFGAKYNMTITTFWVLQLLKMQAKGVSQKEICYELSLPKQTVSNLLAALEKKQYVKKDHDPHDHRSILYFLTDAGSHYITPIDEELYSIEYKAFKSLTEEEREIFTRANMKICQVIENEMLGGEKNGNKS